MDSTQIPLAEWAAQRKYVSRGISDPSLGASAAVDGELSTIEVERAFAEVDVDLHVH